MRRAVNHGGSGIRAAIVLSGVGAVVGWSTGSDFGIGLGFGLAATTAALVITSTRRPAAIGAEEGPDTERHGGWQEVQRELDRCRRHKRSFVLIRIPCTYAGAVGNGHRDHAIEPVTVAESLRPLLRSVDSLWTQDGNVYVLLPESSRAMGEALVARVQRTVPQLLEGGEQLVAFPEDGVTGGALRSMLHGRTVARYSVPFTPDAGRAREMS
jgi:hypothetical protein